jgi:hypothetical protein
MDVLVVSVADKTDRRGASRDTTDDIGAWA